MERLLQTRVLNILNNNLENYQIDIEQLDDDLTLLGLDSFTFMKVVVSLENEFECEIPDSKLFIYEMNTINKIVDVLNLIKHI